MKTQVRMRSIVRRGATSAAIAIAASGCALGQSLSSDSGTPTPDLSASAGAPPVTGRPPWLQPESELANYSTRLGNNRVAAESAIRVGRNLFAQQQYWEVYVKTDPQVLRPEYDPGNPSTFDSAARGARRVDMLMATESGPAIRAFGLGGVEHEKAELMQLAKLLLSYYPAAQTLGFQVFYGENNLHATATYQAGRLDYQGIAG